VPFPQLPLPSQISGVAESPTQVVAPQVVPAA
jgi:hypothetical protein